MVVSKAALSFFYGLPNASAAGYFAAKKYSAAGKNLLYWTDADLEDFAHAVQEFAPKDTQILVFPENPLGQMAALHTLLTASSVYAVAAPYSQWQAALPAPADFLSHTLTIRCGDTYRRSELADFLQQHGYSREDYTENAGQYALRGSVVDIFPPGQPLPLRLYFAGNRIVHR